MMKSRFAGTGYILIDETACDQPHKEESDLLVCAKCENLIRVHDWIDRDGRHHDGHRTDGAYCHRCDRPLCGAGQNNCAASPECTRGNCKSFVVTLEEMINQHYHRQQNARIRGT